jgi:two-component sensor histidine kinase
MASDLRTVATQVLRLETEGDRFALDGEDMPVGPQAALSLTLLLHELATNAIKYGALSVSAGSVRVSWVVDGGTLRLTWQEVGGPPAVRPARTGFGSRLIGMGLAGSRKAAIHYERTGLRAEFDAPLASLAE